jgi:5'-nucleotidase
MRTPSFLVTNDDGIESPFLDALVRALLTVGTVTVVAPSGERSWIAKAISRRGEVGVRERPGLFPCRAWAIDGTPADCVNLGLAHLVDSPIDAVVSGINIGSNAGLPLVLASGTVGGALEGALLGRHAIASSIRLDPSDFATITRISEPTIPPHVRVSLDAVATRTASLARDVARRKEPRRLIVHNLNFPCGFGPASPLRRTMPALMRAGSLFSPVAGSDRRAYAFSFSIGEEQPNARLTDRACIEAGEGSHSILDFGRIGLSAGIAAVSDEQLHLP